MEYRREIDGLRALAVLPVILFQAGSQAFSGGFVGVDIFFVISIGVSASQPKRDTLTKRNSRMLHLRKFTTLSTTIR